MIGERVRHARTYHGWSQKQLADLVGVTQPAISQIEKTGEAGTETLDRIATVTQFARWWFTLGPLPDLPAGSLRFRKMAGSPQKDDERIRAHVRQIIEVVARLSEGVRLPDVRLVPTSSTVDVTEDSIEALAATAREWLGVGPSDPIPNLVRAVERAGVLVVSSAHEVPRHDAASYWPDYPQGRPVVYVNRGYSGDHQRFSLGHEVGHLLLHQLRDVPERKVAESEAHRFSGALLIPRECVLDELASAPVTLRQLAFVKARWGIAISALVRRCLDVGLIDADRRLSLEKQLSARGWRRAEPVTVAPESPRLVPQLIAAAVGSVSPTQLAAKIGLPLMASRDLVA